jgi:hypothetical protein
MSNGSNKSDKNERDISSQEKLVLKRLIEVEKLSTEALKVIEKVKKLPR